MGSDNLKITFLKGSNFILDPLSRIIKDIYTNKTTGKLPASFNKFNIIEDTREIEEKEKKK